MKTRRGWVQGYNAQAVVTPDQIILAAGVTTEANDVRQLTGMLNQAQANVAAVMGEDAVLGAAVANTGYWSEADAESQTEECELFIATQKDRKRVGAAAAARLLLLRRQPRIAFDPVGGGGAEPGLRRGDGGDMVLTGLHVQPRLAVGDVSARQALILLVRKNQMLRLTTPNRQTRVRPRGENAPPG